MRIALIALLLVAGPAARAQAAAPSDVSGFTVFEDPDGRFALRVPPEWFILPAPGGRVCFAAVSIDDGPPLDDVMSNVFCEPVAAAEATTAAEMVEALGTSGGRAAFLAEFEFDMFEADGLFEYLSDGLSALGGVPAARVAYVLAIPSEEDPGGAPVLLRSVMYRAPVTALGVRFTFTCGTTASDVSLCDAVAGTFTTGSHP